MSVATHPSSDPRLQVNGAPDADGTRADVQATGSRPRRPKTRGRRWFWGTLLTVLALLVLAVIAIQIILWTTLPRRLVLDSLQKSLGLRADAASLSAGWFGNTTLRDVRLALPLSGPDESVLDVPELRVKHTWLPWLILGRPVEIKRLELTRPTIHVRQDAGGKWNVAEVAELIARTGGKETADEPGQQSDTRPELPELIIHDGAVLVSDAGGRSLKVEHLAVAGVPNSPITYRYEITVPDHLKLVGQVAPGGAWPHELKIDVQDVHSWARAWQRNGNFPAVRLKAEWEGQAPPEGASGRLVIHELAASGALAHGAVAVARSQGTWSLRPDNLLVNTGQAVAPEMTLAGGQLTYNGERFVSDKLQVATGGGQMLVDGHFDPAVQAGHLSALWTGVSVPRGVSHSGKLDLTLATRIGGRPEVRGTLVTDGSLTSDRGWKGTLNVAADGTGWDDMGIRLTAQQLTCRGPKRTIPVDGLTVATRLRQEPRQNGPPGATDTLLELTELSLPAAQRLRGTGAYNFGTQGWNVRLSGAEWPAPLIEDETVAFTLNAAGDAQKVKLEEMTLAAADVTVTTKGDWVRQRPKPLGVHVQIKHVPPARKTEVVDLRQPENPEVPSVRGTLLGDYTVNGTLAPVDLALEGDLTGKELFLGRRAIGDLSIKVKGQVDASGARLWRDVEKTPALKILGGDWDLGATYSFGREMTTVNFSVKQLPLAQVADAARVGELTGTLDGKWTLHVPGLKASTRRLRLEGDVQARGVKTPSVVVDQVDAKTFLEGGQFTLKDVLARAGRDGTAKVATLTLPIVGDRRVELAGLQLTSWPLTAPDASASATVSGGSESLVVDLPEPKHADAARRKLRAFTQALSLRTSLVTNGVAAGDVAVVAGLEGRVIDVRSVRGSLYGSEVEGQAVIDFDHPLLMRATLYIDGLDPAAVAAAFPGAAAVTGLFNVSLRVQPNRDPHALEPLSLEVNIKSQSARYGQSVDIGNARFLAYMNLDPYFRPIRVVLADQPGSVAAAPKIAPTPVPAAGTTAGGAGRGTASGRVRDPAKGPPPAPGRNRAAPARKNPPDVNTIELAGGLMKVWLRLVRNEDEAGREGATSVTTHVRLGFENLSMDQLVHAADKEAAPTPGLIDGSVVLYGTTRIKPPKGERSRGGPTTQGPQLTFLERVTRSLHGDGAVTIRNADLGRTAIIGGLYSIMRLGTEGNAPRGFGDATFRIEPDRLIITDSYYFNRGVEARALVTVEELHKIPDSPIRGNVVGSARPLKNIDLPLIPDLDRILSAIQATSTSLAVSGTVRNPQLKVIMFQELNNAMRDLLLGGTSAGTKR